MSQLECVLCDELLQDGTETCFVKERGLQSFIEASNKRKDEKAGIFKRGSSIEVHVKCRKNYVTEKSIAAYLNRAAQNVPKQTRSKERGFLFKSHCFLCGNEVPPDYNKREMKNTPAKRNMVYPVRTLSVREKVMSLAEDRNDEYGQSVLLRLRQVQDLCAADAQYHFRCMRALHHAPKSTQTEKRGSYEVEAAMQSIISYLKKSDEECQFTIEELMDQIEGDFRPHPSTVRRHLLQTFGEDIVVTSKTPYVACFKASGEKIITENWFREVEKLTEKEERRRIVETAAAIVVEDIRSQINDVTEYPPTDKFLDGVDDVIPETLRVFIETVVLNKKRGNLEPWKKKSVAIAHTLISAVRPISFLSPLQVGLAAFLLKKYG